MLFSTEMGDYAVPATFAVPSSQFTPEGDRIKEHLVKMDRML